jgi:hypothetical protein
MRSTSLLGTSYLDIFAEIYWRGEKIGTTQAMKSTASVTSVGSKDKQQGQGQGQQQQLLTCEVVWENEVFQSISYITLMIPNVDLRHWT